MSARHMHTLPNEILSHIFLQYLPAYPLCPPLYGPESPSFLMTVCRHWQAIALQTPELWRAIEVGSAWRRRLAPPSLLPTIETWLVRSASCMLSVNLPDDPSLYPATVLRALLAHSSRMEYLFCTVDNDQVAIYLGPALPHLRELSIGGWKGWNDPLVVKMKPSSAPLLHTLFLFEVDLVASNFPWAQLTTLTLVGSPESAYLQVLRQTPRLIHCRLSVVSGEDPTAAPPTSRIILPHLRTLAVHHDDHDPNRDYLLDALTTPALRRLQLRAPILGEDPIQNLRVFIAHCGCKLDVLRVLPASSRGVQVDNVPIEEYSKAFPEIRVVMPRAEYWTPDDRWLNEDK
ncbi:YDG domain-containing protein [Mycena indigotica]|uniref:YDG domain-containing protein n=1 Tax=Mycena indigotica TaxID=2126181 RepID=A0A8H6W190_9AGAR|nr:YDG domain-containing protein [Mycena indigotica]KAF7295689.1 YDG domain-containing protein [Mycena indigotica]